MDAGVVKIHNLGHSHECSELSSYSKVKAFDWWISCSSFQVPWLLGGFRKFWIHQTLPKCIAVQLILPCLIGWVEIQKKFKIWNVQPELNVIHKNKTLLPKKNISKVHRLLLKWQNMFFKSPLKWIFEMSNLNWM